MEKQINKRAISSKIRQLEEFAALKTVRKIKRIDPQTKEETICLYCPIQDKLMTIYTSTHYIEQFGRKSQS